MKAINRAALSQTVTQERAPSLALAYDNGTNRISSAGYGYDVNGNMTASPGFGGPSIGLGRAMAIIVKLCRPCTRKLDAGESVTKRKRLSNNKKRMIAGGTD